MENNFTNEFCLFQFNCESAKMHALNCKKKQDRGCSAVVARSLCM